MAKKSVKKSRKDDPLGKLIVEGIQLGTNKPLLLSGIACAVLGVICLLACLTMRQFTVFLVIGLLILVAAAAIITAALRQVPMHLEVRSNGLRYESRHRFVELEWDDIKSVYVQMLSSNSLLTFSGVGDPGDYIRKRANSMPFQVMIRGHEGQSLTFSSKLLPYSSGGDVIDKLVRSLPEKAMSYELFVALPRFADDD
jgi:hypothetical protein